MHMCTIYNLYVYTEYTYFPRSATATLRPPFPKVVGEAARNSHVAQALLVILVTSTSTVELAVVLLLFLLRIHATGIFT